MQKIAKKFVEVMRDCSHVANKRKKATQIESPSCVICRSSAVFGGFSLFSNRLVHYKIAGV